MARTFDDMGGLGGILRRYWRGELSLAVSFWLFFFGLTLVVSTLDKPVETLAEGRDFDPRRIFAFVVANFILLGALGIYQWVGLWRSARRSRRERRALGRRAAWSWIVQIVIVFGAANVARIAIVRFAPSVREFYTIALRGDPSVPDFAMRATPDGTQLLVFGGFKFGLTERFAALADAMPNLRTVHLASGGGRIGEAEHLARVIAARGLDTYVSDICYSACTLAYAAGRKRWFLDGAKLGYHSESFMGVALHRAGGDSERAALLRAGLGAAFVDKAMATSPREMWVPTLAELRGAGAITDVAPPDRFAASNLGMAPSDAKIAADLKQLALPTALARGQPQRFAALVTALREAYDAGKSVAALHMIIGAAEDTAVAEALPKADDATLVAYAGLAVEEYEARLAAGSAGCYSFATGAAGAGAFLDARLQARDTAFKIRLVGAPLENRPAANDALENVFVEKLARSVSKADLAALSTAPKDAAAQAAFCRGMIGTLRAAAAFPQAQAGALLRGLLAVK